MTLHTGMRRGEVAGLRWKDVELTKATLTVSQQRTVAARSGDRRRAEGKESAGSCTWRRRRWRRCSDIARRSGWSGWRAPGRRGRTRATCSSTRRSPYHPQRLREMFQKACNAIGVPAIRFHDYADVRVMPTGAVDALPREVSRLYRSA